MGVSSQSHSVDESTLANDVVRLLGGENQRLRLELQEAERRVRDAERRAEEAEARTATRVRCLSEYKYVDSNYVTLLPVSRRSMPIPHQTRPQHTESNSYSRKVRVSARGSKS